MEYVTTQELALRVACALALGALVGAERQWRQRLAGLRTNTLVAVGAALFVALSAMVEDVSATRVAAQVVSGIGFLGAGVIFKEGASVRGLDTAATLWCSAAVGVLAGSGFYIAASLGAAAILLTNMLIRPLVPIINRQPMEDIESDVAYRLRVICAEGEEARVREGLLGAADQNEILIRAIFSEDMDQSRAEVIADFLTTGRRDSLIEDVLRQLSITPRVSAISWEIRAPAG
jgi:putative Mg2+ transporter-C (MgtC) family protein